VQSSTKRIFDRMGYRFEPRWKPVDKQEVV
jgi:hypothetical protein